jgi:hypothetical protein
MLERIRVYPAMEYLITSPSGVDHIITIERAGHKRKAEDRILEGKKGRIKAPAIIKANGGKIKLLPVIIILLLLDKKLT